MALNKTVEKPFSLPFPPSEFAVAKGDDLPSSVLNEMLSNSEKYDFVVFLDQSLRAFMEKKKTKTRISGISAQQCLLANALFALFRLKAEEEEDNSANPADVG